jgi:hypothetical protein
MRIILGFIFITLSLTVVGLPLKTDEPILDNAPPRIIRTCCSFGSEVRVTGIPFLKVTDISSIEMLGPHKYLGNDEENNGIIYTRKGGFIDIGHLRDQADWTAYLHLRMLKKNSDNLIIELGREGGQKRLEICDSAIDNPLNKILLAGKIAYNLSVWHEISTFFGASYIPMVPERYSAFSIEDAYSNLLGVQIGMAAIQSELPYEEAVTKLLASKLKELEGVESYEETVEAMEAVRDFWWTREAKLPSKNILLRREFDLENCLAPWLINDIEHSTINVKTICSPQKTEEGIPLDEFYELSIQLNSKFPVKKILDRSDNRIITQHDFYILIDEASRKTELDHMAIKP